MLRFIQAPHLPKGKVRRVLLGGRYRGELAEGLKKYDLHPIWMPDNPRVDARLAGHVDLSAVHLGGDKLVLSRDMADNEVEFVEFLTTAGLQIIESQAEQGRDYPMDAVLNACIISDVLLHNLDNTDPAITEGFNARMSLSVKQGYTKCSVCVVDRHSIITADKGIAEAAELCGIDSLLISPGHIALDGYDTGFIGGASFKLSGNIMAFTGHLREHPDGKSIENYIKSRGVTPVYLTHEPIFDIGSAIPLTEETA